MACYDRLWILLHRFANHSNRIATLEANQKNYLDRLDKNPDLCMDVSYIKGLFDEHLKK
jgi:hypothetical protein